MGFLRKNISDEERSKLLFYDSYLGGTAVDRHQIVCYNKTRTIAIKEVTRTLKPGIWHNYVRIETSDGKKIRVPTKDKEGLIAAIEAARVSAGSSTPQASKADELKKFAELRKQRVITETEFEQKKKQLLE